MFRSLSKLAVLALAAFGLVAGVLAAMLATPLAAPPALQSIQTGARAMDQSKLQPLG